MSKYKSFNFNRHIIDYKVVEESWAKFLYMLASEIIIMASFTFPFLETLN